MSRRTRTLELIVYLIFLAAVFEGLTRLAISIPRFTNRIPVTDNAWWHDSWMRRHARTGNAIFYDFDIYDPTKGWAARPDLTDRVAFDNQRLSTNSKGLRGKTEHAYEKTPGKVRILVLGDSFTFGDEVSDDETYCHYLQEMLPQAEIINMGVHGYGHDQMLILFREEGVKYKPDIVLLGFIGMDMPRNVLSFRDYAKPRFVVRHGKLVLTGTPVPPPEEILARHPIRSRALELLAALWERAMKASGLYERNMEKTTTAILSEIARLSRSVGATPVFVYLPTAKDLSRPPSPPGEPYLFSACKTIGDVRCFSVLPDFTTHFSNVDAFMPGGHWPPPGHRVVAEAIRTYLLDQGLVGPPAR